MLEFFNYRSIAFTVAGYDIYWYGLIICAAILIAILIACAYSKKKGYGSEMPINIALVVVPSGVLGARAFSVMFEETLTWADYFNFRTGGLSIIGGIICGALGLLIYCLIKRDKDVFKYFDVLAVVLILAQAIGRWGNFFNQEVFGHEIAATSIFARFPIAVKIDGQYYQALFFYESCFDLIGFFVLTNVYFGSVANGYTTALYLVYYGLIRTILEPLRHSEYILMWNGLQISRLVSFLLIFVGIILYIAISIKITRKKVYKYGKKGTNG